MPSTYVGEDCGTPEVYHGVVCQDKEGFTAGYSRLLSRGTHWE